MQSLLEQFDELEKEKKREQHIDIKMEPLGQDRPIVIGCMMHTWRWCLSMFMTSTSVADIDE
jgi:hypothetical protein